ncbi:hypothetical protein AGABI2DRAFT_136168 [Agaricus bisporus var. bisporus H97]|uniref:hypothetical protein n=1 Tax=Agaricus bisporus var. bisporus (strain H97 / ATCC MYA-4626 / FGSC 10389) TaxID=936046 RepID=UPI00029F57E6|nr:hypothetical protein AGABI2DRAFT_136168 [Agaricus bisporus var. bisporus H97]EKV47470.1 hypothetical protein AGABI2DRAFT_136168 [Agaricus bisporus var. bisporus H97]
MAEERFYTLYEESYIVIELLDICLLTFCKPARRVSHSASGTTYKWNDTMTPNLEVQ